jgi:hypothetical protein
MGIEMHADLEAVLARELAGYTVRSVKPLGAGVDNIAYEVNDERLWADSHGHGVGRLRRRPRPA